MDVEALAVRSGSLDIVLGVSILHHVDLSRALLEIRRVLRPGGRIAFSEPNMLNPQLAAMKKIPPVRRLLGETPFETALTRWGLARALRRHGFDDVRVAPGLHTYDVESAQGWLKKGIRLLGYSGDSSFIVDTGTQIVNSLRAFLSAR